MNSGRPRRFAPQQFLALLALLLLVEPAIAPAVTASEKPSVGNAQRVALDAAPAAQATAPSSPDASKAAPPASKSESKNDNSKIETAAVAAPKGDVALDGDRTRTRFIIGLDKQAEFQVFSLANPNRVIVDLATTSMRLPETPDNGLSVGLVNSFRAGLSGPGRTRVVIDVTQPVVVESAKIEKTKDGKGQRLALDIVPVAVESKASPRKPLKIQPAALGGASLMQPPVPIPAVRPDVRAAKAFKPIIVIDPGHGGHDSGAMKNGAVEKDVVLAFSKMLRDKLEKTGRYKVMMTRSDDTFVELGERVAYAERNNANLFIAVHADYADDNSKARGATIYSLRESVANALQRSAKGEVSDRVLSKNEIEEVRKASIDDDLAAVKSILADLVGREVTVTKERTSVFSRSVIELMGASTEMRSEPDQQAAFRVLKTAQFPSVLIELAYVTNKEDAALLQSDAWRDKVSDSIMIAVENYFSNQIARLPM